MGSYGLTARGRSLAVLAVAAIALGAGLLVACGGGGKAGGTPTPGASATAVPRYQPTIEGSLFNFPARGYASVIPAGWNANPNSLLAGPQQVDTFFSPDTVDGVQANISVTCEENPANIATQQFVEIRLATLSKLGATDVKALGTTTVAGVDAAAVSYTLTRGDTNIAKVDVMFTTPRCAWTLAMASAPSTVAQTETIFAEFLKSFNLLPDATPRAGA